MDKPLVSVITPAWNTGNYLPEAIESILNQTYTHFEFIILDDASTDNTWDVIQEYAKRDSRIIPIKNEKNLYIASNRNKGLDIAKGKYIVWQDGDDISMPDRIEKQVSFMEENPEVGICGGYLQSFNVNMDLDIRKYAPDDKTIRKCIFKFSPVAQPASIVRHTSLVAVGKFDINFPPAEDLELAFRIGSKYKFANLQSVLLRYREHPTSATGSRLKLMITKTLYIRKLNMSNPAYKFTVSDTLAYMVSWVAMYIPVTLTTNIFKMFRKLF